MYQVNPLSPLSFLSPTYIPNIRFLSENGVKHCVQFMLINAMNLENCPIIHCRDKVILLLKSGVGGGVDTHFSKIVVPIPICAANTKMFALFFI